jgi:hypothetical protein
LRIRELFQFFLPPPPFLPQAKMVNEAARLLFTLFASCRRAAIAKALHSKPKVFFTSSPIPGSLACEVVSLRCRFIALVKPLRL